MNLINGYVYIPVSNFDKSVDWYETMLGFTLVFNDPLYREMKTKSGIRIMLIERRGGVNSHMMYDTGAQASYGFTVNNIENIHAELISKGAAVKKIGEYQGKSFSFVDIDGNVLELWEENNYE